MKKILSTLVFATVVYCAFSQNSVASNTPKISTEMKAGETLPSVSSKNASTKAVKNFKKTFKNVTNEKWYEMPDGYRVNFTVKDIRCRLDYDKNGNLMHTIKYYDEKKLPVEVRRLVVSTYLDYSIRTVEEIEVPHNTLFYVIHLEGETNWINIKVSDNEINELERIKKS